MHSLARSSLSKTPISITSMTVGGGGAGGVTSGKKRQRGGSNSRLSSTMGIIDTSRPDNTLTERSQKPSLNILRRTASSSSSSGFNDSATADVVLRLFVDQQPLFDTSDDSESISAVDSADQSDVQIHLHSDVLFRRSKYFAALLSDRWQKESNDVVDSGRMLRRLNLGVPATSGSIDHHLTVLQLLYTNDFTTTISNVSIALDLLPVALELIFEDCIKACVQFLEAVPWTEDEERKVLTLVPFLGKEESQELLARVSIDNDKNHDSSEQMLHGLISSALHNHPNMAFAKAFVAKLLRDFSSKEAAKRVLERAFESSLKIVKDSLEDYSSPDFRGDHNETEAIQRLNLHTAMTNGRHLLWLVERMIELRVADAAVQAWSNQPLLTADLLRALRDEAWRNIVPGLPAVVLRCTCKLANALVTGTILATRQLTYEGAPWCTKHLVVTLGLGRPHLCRCYVGSLL